MFSRELGAILFLFDIAIESFSDQAGDFAAFAMLVYNQPFEIFDLVLKNPNAHLSGFSVGIKNFRVHKTTAYCATLDISTQEKQN
jgi:hypothetical protein